METLDVITPCYTKENKMKEELTSNQLVNLRLEILKAIAPTCLPSDLAELSIPEADAILLRTLAFCDVIERSILR